jgi:hypothetical protein
MKFQNAYVQFKTNEAPRAYTADEWAHDNNRTLRHAVDMKKHKLVNEAGDRLCFRHGEVVRPYFARPPGSDRGYDDALARKYATAPETPEHFAAKHAIDKVTSFLYKCARGEAVCGNVVTPLTIDTGGLLYKTEQRVGKYIIDGGFFDKSTGELRYAFEVFMTSATCGLKLEFLEKHPCTYIEVCATDVVPGETCMVLAHDMDTKICEDCEDCEVCDRVEYEQIPVNERERENLSEARDFWKKSCNNENTIREMVLKLPSNTVLRDDKIMYVLTFDPQAAVKFKPHSFISRSGTMLLLHDEYGVPYDSIGWLKGFKAMCKAKQQVVNVSEYLEVEIRQAQMTRERISDSDWSVKNSAASRVVGLRKLQESGIQQVQLTNVNGIVEFTNAGQMITYSLSSGKHRRKGSGWVGGSF